MSIYNLKNRRIPMIKLFGKEYPKNTVLYFISFVLSIILIFLNILFAILFSDSIFNLYMLTGVLLFLSSGLNLFAKKK